MPLMIEFAKLPLDERTPFFQEVATSRGLTRLIVEKEGNGDVPVAKARSTRTSPHALRIYRMNRIHTEKQYINIDVD